MPMGCGGPHAAYFACRDAFKRSLPGRLVGVSVVSPENQHIACCRLETTHPSRESDLKHLYRTGSACCRCRNVRRLSWPRWAQENAEGIAKKTTLLATGLQKLGIEITNQHAFIRCVSELEGNRFIYKGTHKCWNESRKIDANHIGISLDETTCDADVNALGHFHTSRKFCRRTEHMGTIYFVTSSDTCIRKSDTPMFFIPSQRDPVVRELADRDHALDRTMIPLGSCTMKLNATSEMIPISWPEFADIHPLHHLTSFRDIRCSKSSSVSGWVKPLDMLASASAERWKPRRIRRTPCYSGLATRARLRNICLIPASAHGTNPASAQMAGMKIVVTGCDDQGNVDLVELQEKCEQFMKLAAVMITYPSTHGVFESEIKNLCDIVHDHGGRVYIDGANMNALVGTPNPGTLVVMWSSQSSQNICIPHGGGGPGVGPVCVVEDLVPFLPGHETSGVQTSGGVGAISAAPLGNAGVLPAFSWMYCRMMGSSGLRHATEAAILAANYVGVRLRSLSPLYRDTWTHCP